MGSVPPTRSSSSDVFKVKTIVLSFALFASISTVTHNSRQLQPAFLSSLTELDSSGVYRNLQDASNLVWNATAEALWYAGGYGSGGNYVALDDDTTTHAQGPQQPKRSRHEDLVQLTRSRDIMECPSNLKAVEMVSNPVADAGEGRLIPKIVHITGKTKCLTDAFYEGAKLWQFENHSFYFHDDQAVEELFNRDWPMFPQLKNTIQCLKGAGGAAFADLWRYLALYEYGGIYTDMDNHPNTLFNATSIPNDTDAYFLQEGGGFLSQYFFAVSPKHPMMFLAVHDVMQQMHSVMDTGNFYVPVTSGPGATKRAFLNFMGLNSTNLDAIAAQYSKPSTGHYISRGFGNHSVTVFGNRRTGNDYVIRSAIAGFRKRQGWKEMGIQNYQGANGQPSGKTCIRVLHEHYSAQAESESEVLKEAYRRQRF